ncbi:hypothetical protein [Geodermatophilus ruber]|uniref:Uncharacterized protein n=1 Tax=Geodermatophilus ruber TaxID=504800 RepID=A0A1I4DRY9_9ACTN|nr:hypothetical protein [Geodermatophilus ruber]SFK96145.1 hypothetical protein SAMN04488085_1057 [Geodermatophilus ruber]
MTHSIDTPFPPPPSGSGATAGGTGTTGSPSTTEVARDEARTVGQTAAQAGSQVASTAAGQAEEVVRETRMQAQDLVNQGRTQLRDQAATQQQKAAQGLQGLAGQLRGMAEGSGAPSGPARDLVEQATGKVEEFAGWLQNREPGDLLEEVRSFARRKPGTFLLGAALAGVVAGRLTSGVKAAHTDNGPSGTDRRAVPVSYAQTNYVDPSPAYSGYTPTTTGYDETAAYSGTAAPGTAPVPPPPYGTVPPAGAAVPPTTPAGWDDPTRTPGRGV